MVLDDVPVTIIGGGPVGLTVALCLSRHGIASRVVELKATTTDHPKARGVFARAMEIFRQLGVEQRIRDGGLPDGSDNFVLLDGLENEVGRSAAETPNKGVLARKCIVAQDIVEEALVWKIQDHPDIQIYWETEFLDAEADDSGVRIAARDLKSGELASWRSLYVVGADGGAGVAAKAGGIEYERTPILATMLNTYFKADLSAYQSVKNSAVLVLRFDALRQPISILNKNGATHWLMLSPVGRETDERSHQWTNDETIAFLREALRQPDLEIEILNESVWRVTRRIAQKFRNGRFFLAGDAAHRFPPTGGFGLNSGIEDAHNLAWKLAFVLTGKASEALLETYEPERRPIAFANAELAFRNYARQPLVRAALMSLNQDRLDFWVRDLDHHTNNGGHVLGFAYGEGAFVPDGTTEPPHTPSDYVQIDRPGSRYPHVWLDEGRTLSTLDLFDRDLVLMVGPNGKAWEEPAATVAESMKVPLRVHHLERISRSDGLQMGQSGAVLVRPDGVTAWRIGWVPDDPVAELQKAVRKVLGTKPKGH